ncbi:MAG: GNAT family N-acetyltransferase [Candidatus Neomarinimicrobiota bacterium]
MKSRPSPKLSLDIKPLTRQNWSDLEKLFGPKGAYGGCWCMWWRSTRSEFEKMQGEGNRNAMKEIVKSGEVPGILAYSDGEPVGWCSVAPRESFASLNRSRVLKRLDDKPVWSIVCFFVARQYRHQDLNVKLIEGVVDYVRRQGGKVIEAYPTEPRGRQLSPVSIFMGSPSAFRRAGFEECARPSKSKIIMRYHIK